MVQSGLAMFKAIVCGWSAAHDQGVTCSEAKDQEKEAKELVLSRRLAIMQLQEIIALAKSIKL